MAASASFASSALFPDHKYLELDPCGICYSSADYSDKSIKATQLLPTLPCCAHRAHVSCLNALQQKHTMDSHPEIRCPHCTKIIERDQLTTLIFLDRKPKEEAILPPPPNYAFNCDKEAENSINTHIRDLGQTLQLNSVEITALLAQFKKSLSKCDCSMSHYPLTPKDAARWVVEELKRQKISFSLPSEQSAQTELLSHLEKHFQEILPPELAPEDRDAHLRNAIVLLNQDPPFFLQPLIDPFLQRRRERLEKNALILMRSEGLADFLKSSEIDQKRHIANLLFGYSRLFLPQFQQDIIACQDPNLKARMFRLKEASVIFTSIDGQYAWTSDDKKTERLTALFHRAVYMEHAERWDGVYIPQKIIHARYQCFLNIQSCLPSPTTDHYVLGFHFAKTCSPHEVQIAKTLAAIYHSHPHIIPSPHKNLILHLLIFSIICALMLYLYLSARKY